MKWEMLIETLKSKPVNEPIQLSPRRASVLRGAFADGESRAIIGQELLLPLRDLLSAETSPSWLRKAARPKPLSQGEVFVVEPVDRQLIYAASLAAHSRAVHVFALAQAKLAETVTCRPLAELAVMLDDLDKDDTLGEAINRAQRTGFEEIVLEEDLALYSLIEAAWPEPMRFAKFDAHAIDSLLSQVLGEPATITINRTLLNQLMVKGHCGIEPTTERQMVMNGFIGVHKKSGAHVYMSAANCEEVVPLNEAIVTAKGAIDAGQRVDPWSEPFVKKDVGYGGYGWAWSEILHVVLRDRRKVVRGRIG